METKIENMAEVPIRRFEVNYRGIFQKILAYRITKDLVYIAHSQGTTAFSNGRYSDDPQRNGVPCANFAFFSNGLSEEELEAIASAKMDIEKADIVSVLDDTMVKGLEPWGHYGIRPINEKVVPGGTLLVVSRKNPDELIRFLERKPFNYRLGILPGDASFGGLWYYRDDNTDVRMVGAVARITPEIINLEKAREYMRKTYKTEEKIREFEDGYNSVKFITVNQDKGIVWPYSKPVLPAWNEFDEGIVVKAVRGDFKMGPRGLARNPDYKRGTSKTQRPVVRFDTCTKCTLCWYTCPDEAFDPAPDGLFDVNYDYCTGCGRCAQVCPVNDCIVMIDDLIFSDNSSPWESFKKDPKAYTKAIEEKKGKERITPSFVTGKREKNTELATPVPFKESKQ